ncbi:hypothetical protein IPG41_03760 [Candidatus Peregrinibacteria bacterium]|nr:MAG: hypothetical protein IPG41_03760 [Candidatus Peregrinibacteria bacterium]
MQNVKHKLLSLGAFFLLLTGCNSITQSIDGWTDSLEISAVESLNSYIDFTNAALDAVEYLDENVQYTESDLVYFEDYDDAYEVYFTCSFNLYDREKFYEDTTNPQGLEESEAEDLKAQSIAIFAILDTIDTQCKELHKYVAAQEYKIDLEKGYAHIQNLYTEIDKYYDAHDALGEKVETLLEKYETWTVDYSDPTSVAIDNMRKDLKQADSVVDLLADIYETSDYARRAELQSLYDALSTQVSSHSGENLLAADEVDLITPFYESMDLNFLPNVSAALIATNAQDSEALYSIYQNSLTYYNEMTEHYNHFLDSMGR